MTSSKDSDRLMDPEEVMDSPDHDEDVTDGADEGDLEVDLKAPGIIIEKNDRSSRFLSMCRFRSFTSPRTRKADTKSSTDFSA